MCLFTETAVCKFLPGFDGRNAGKRFILSVVSNYKFFLLLCTVHCAVDLPEERDRQTDRQTERQRQRDRDRNTERERGIITNKQVGK